MIKRKLNSFFSLSKKKRKNSLKKNKVETPIYDDAGRIHSSRIRLEKDAKCEFGKAIPSKDVHKGTPEAEPNGWAAYAKWLAGLSFNFFGGFFSFFLLIITVINLNLSFKLMFLLFKSSIFK